MVIDLPGAARGLFPFTPRFVEVRGRRMHFVDEGSGDPLVMLHGNPTWSFFFRPLIAGLSSGYRCIAPDHIGCGLSARPGADEYGFRLQDRAADLEAFVDRLRLSRPITLVLHDWGGAIGAAFAVRHPERIARLVLFNTAAFRKPPGKPLPWMLRLIRAHPRFAYASVVGLNLFAIGAALAAPAKPLNPAVRRALLAPTRGAKNRLAVLRFVQDIPVSPGDPSHSLLAEIEAGLARLAAAPVFIAWGERDFVFDSDYLAEWTRRFPGAEVHRFPRAGHYLLEDEPERITALVAEFLARHPAAGRAIEPAPRMV
jgi:haloalkane dehalogenase